MPTGNTPPLPVNLLPRDGSALYYGPVLSPRQASRCMNKLLLEIDWQHDRAIIFGKSHLTRRQVAWHADGPYPYTYSRVRRTALPWTPTLLQLRQWIEKVSGYSYNACLLNLYHDGSEGMGWHSDKEKDLVPCAAIASLSLGAERPFFFKHKTADLSCSQQLEHGALLVMKGTTQQHWLHRLPPRKAITQPRINLTFRTMVTPT